MAETDHDHDAGRVELPGEYVFRLFHDSADGPFWLLFDPDHKPIGGAFDEPEMRAFAATLSGQQGGAVPAGDLRLIHPLTGNTHVLDQNTGRTVRIEKSEGRLTRAEAISLLRRAADTLSDPEAGYGVSAQIAAIADTLRARFAEQTAPAGTESPGLREVAMLHALRAVNQKDCERLIADLPDSAHGRFWKDIARDLVDALKTPAEPMRLDILKQHPRGASPAPVVTVDDPDEAYKLGKDDGYAAAVADIDRLTGGDGEYVHSMGGPSEAHCPDSGAMIVRIQRRFAASAGTGADAAYERGVFDGSVMGTDVTRTFVDAAKAIVAEADQQIPNHVSLYAIPSSQIRALRAALDAGSSEEGR